MKMPVTRKGRVATPRNIQVAKYFDRMAGMLGTRGKLTRALLEERAADRKREDR